MTRSSKKSGIKPGSLPPSGRNGNHPYDWRQVAEDLRAAPGEWHLVFENDRHTLAHAISQNGIVALRSSKGFETSTRNNVRHEDGSRTCDLWMRYVPEQDLERSK